VIAGLGGRAITRKSLRRLFEEGVADKLKPLSFLDMDWELVERELERVRSGPSGPHEQNMLRDIGVVAAGPH
jgi:pyruvate ferredoxin oxidoreductase alpha subunit